MRLADPEKRKAFVQKVMEALTPLEAKTAYLFGTYGSDRERKESDVDLAFISRKKHHPLEVQTVAQTLSEMLKKDVDLLDLSVVSTAMKFSTVTSGDRLFDLDPNLRQEFEMYAISDYLRLKEERAPVLESVRKDFE